MSDLVGNPEDRFSHNEALMIHNMNAPMQKKLSSGFPTRCDTIRAVQLEKVARVWEEEGCTIYAAITKA